MHGRLCVNARLVMCECAVSGTRIQDAPRAFRKKARAFKTRIQDKKARIQDKKARIQDKNARIQRAFSAHSGQNACTKGCFLEGGGLIWKVQSMHHLHILR